MKNITKIIYFTISRGFSKGVYAILLFIIDYRFDDVVTGNSSAKIAVISLLSFLIMYGGGDSIFREGVIHFKKAKRLLNTHILIGFLSILIIYLTGLIDEFTFSIALLTLFFNLIESYYKSKYQDFVMMIISMSKFILIIGAFSFFNFDFASVFLFWLSICLVVLYIVLTGFRIVNYSKIELYSWHSLLIGVFFLFINSRDKYISLFFI